MHSADPVDQFDVGAHRGAGAGASGHDEDVTRLDRVELLVGDDGDGSIFCLSR